MLRSDVAVRTHCWMRAVPCHCGASYRLAVSGILHSHTPSFAVARTTLTFPQLPPSGCVRRCNALRAAVSGVRPLRAAAAELGGSQSSVSLVATPSVCRGCIAVSGLLLCVWSWGVCCPLTAMWSVYWCDQVALAGAFAGLVSAFCVRSRWSRFLRVNDSDWRCSGPHSDVCLWW